MNSWKDRTGTICMYPDKSTEQHAAKVAVITSCSRLLYHQQIYGKCLDTWHHLTYDKYLFSEDGLELTGFQSQDLAALYNATGFFSKKRSSAVSRFYRKALSIFWALTNLNHDLIIWLDSDVEVLAPVQGMPVMNQAIASMFYPWPGQHDNLIENGGIDTGMIWFDMHRLSNSFAQEYIDYWHSEKIHLLTKPKDTFVMMDLLSRYPMQNLMQQYVHLPSGSNYFDHTIFSGMLYHHIGRGQK